MQPIIGILQLMGNPQFHLHELLHLICERFPLEDISYQHVKVTCPIHEVHSVSNLGFILLEMVEDVNGPSELKVGSVLLGHVNGPLVPALKSRVIRQEETISMGIAHSFQCRNQDDAETLLTLVQRTEGIGFQKLVIWGEIGEGGWAALAEALRLLPQNRLTGFQELLVAERQVILQARRGDVRTVWEALAQGSKLLQNCSATALGPRGFFRKESEEEWVRLEQYLDNEDEVESEN